MFFPLMDCFHCGVNNVVGISWHFLHQICRFDDILDLGSSQDLAELDENGLLDVCLSQDREELDQNGQLDVRLSRARPEWSARCPLDPGSNGSFCKML